MLDPAYFVAMRGLALGGGREPADAENLKEKAAATQERYKFKFDVAKLAADWRIELPKEITGDELTDDFRRSMSPTRSAAATGRRISNIDRSAGAGLAALGHLGRHGPGSSQVAHALKRASPACRTRHVAIGDDAGWLCLRSRSASATNRMPKTIE